MKQISKVLLISLLSLILVSTAACQKNNNSTAKNQTAGAKQNQQKSAKENKSNKEGKYLLTKVITEDVAEDKKYVSREKEYNDAGKLIKDVRYNKKGEVRDYEKREYNQAGKIKKVTELRNIGGDKLKITRTYQYNDAGRKVSYIDKTSAGAKCGEGKYKYYPDGTLKYKYTKNIHQGRTKKIYYNKQGEKTKKIDNSNILDMHTVSHYKREYDEQGRKVKEIEIKKVKDTGEKIRNIDYYNENGQIVKSITRNGDSIPFWFEWEYDKEGNRTKLISKDSDGEVIKIKEYTFDKNGNRIKKICKDIKENGEEKIWLWVESEYNSNGNEVRTKYKGAHGEKVGTVLYYKYKKI